MNKVIMRRVWHDGCVDKHSGKKEITFKTPVYTLFKQEDFGLYTIVAQYGDGTCSNWICYNARQALTCFRMMVGMK